MTKNSDLGIRGEHPEVRTILKTDTVVDSIVDSFISRASKGKTKYGHTLDRQDLSVLDWIEHAQQELQDGILYLEKLKQTLKSKSQDVIEEAIIHLRKKFHKRKEFIMERHLIEEQKSLNRLAQDLASEFGMEKEHVEEVMETFDGTTRHIYYHLQSINNNRVPPTAEEVEMIPKTVEPQPRHVLRYDEMKWQPLWQEVITEKKVWGAL